MDQKDLKHYETLLREEKKKREDSLIDEGMGLDISMRDQTGELSSYDNHPGDLGNETYEAEKNLSFRTREKFLLGEVEAALKRIEEGTFGQCEMCHREIERDRLDVRPYTRLCIHCENDMEQKKDDEEKGRPIEEKVIYPPFGRSFTDNSTEDSIIFDGEDTWDSVNEYNVRMSDNQYGEDDERVGYVEDVEQISNEQYRRQLE